MSKVKVYNLQGKEVDQVELNPSIFDVEVNPNLVSQVVRVQEANARHVLSHAKSRGEVRGGGRKPWRQKGTGRARAGTSRSPLWIGGAVTFGPNKFRNFSLNINKKQKRKALFMTLSDKARENKIIIVDSLNLEAPKTKELIQALTKIKVDGSALLTTSGTSQNLIKASNNIQKVDSISADSLNVLDLLKHNYLVLDKESLEVIEKTYKA